MARIRINLPDSFIFSTEIRVRMSDINRGGHVGWNLMFGILDEARVQFWDAIGISETADETASNIMADAGINYKRQTYYGQVLRIEITAADIAEKSFDIVYRVTDAETGEEVARAKTGMLCFNYVEQKIAPIPEEYKKKLLGEI